MMPGKKCYWILWLLGSALLSLGLYASLSGEMDQSILMPGPLSDGHHQLVDKCNACHVNAFGGEELMQEACLECHGDERKKPQDSHPLSKFKDPRNAELLEKINAQACISCHTEHRPAITLKDGLTQPLDVCAHCHGEIGEDRESHRDMDFASCKNSGCHNFHNNRALYTDFLIKHLDEPALLQRPRLKPREFADILDELVDYPHDRYPVQTLAIQDADHPATVQVSASTLQDWHQTSHAQAGVNCSACHQPVNAAGEPQAWIEKPDQSTCSQCHNLEVERFKLGKHGMRLGSGLPPMQVKDARLPMRDKAQHKETGCISCHDDHRFDVKTAAVKACLGCHADEHSLAYENSPHAQLWRAEITGNAAENTGVSCASCHLPRVNYDVNDWVTRIMVDHNQSANLSPNSKMLRSVCLHCHGLDFSLKAMADPNQVRSNFAQTPDAEEHPSMVLARQDNERYMRELAEGRSK